MLVHARPRTGRPATKEPSLSLGMLPLARRDIERLRQILTLQRRLTDMNRVAARPARADPPRRRSRKR